GQAGDPAQFRHAGTRPSLRPGAGVQRRTRGCHAGTQCDLRRGHCRHGDGRVFERSCGMSDGALSQNLYAAIQPRPNRGLGGLYVVVAAFLLLYVWLFPGIVSLGGFSKFTQNWFPLALVTMAQALLMLNGGITLAVGPLVSLGAVIAATLMGGPAGTVG